MNSFGKAHGRYACFVAALAGVIAYSSIALGQVSGNSPTQASASPAENDLQVNPVPLGTYDAESAEALLFGIGRPADPKIAESQLLQLSSRGDGKAKLFLGRAYVWGTPVSGKAKAGLRLLDEAANLGEPAAFYELGVAYLWGGKEFKASPAEARRYLEEASKRSNKDAKRLLGEQLMIGGIFKQELYAGENMLLGLVSQSDVKAKAVLGRIYASDLASLGKGGRGLRMLEDAAANGSTEAKLALGQYYLSNRKSTEEEVERAFSLLEQAAAVNPAAQLAMAQQLLFGRRSYRNVSRGEAMLENLAAKGDPRAMLALGQRYTMGESSPERKLKGVRLLEKSARLGQREAMYELAALYLWGKGNIRSDGELARRYLELAAGNGDRRAAVLLGEQLISGGKFSAEPKRGLKLLEDLIKSGDAAAARTLGRLLLFGDGLRRDTFRSEKLLRMAIGKSDAEAMEILGGARMWSAASAAQAAEAETLLMKAARAGAGKAWLTLAQGATYKKLTAQGNEKYALYEKNARKAGARGLAVLQAERLMWGIEAVADKPKAVALLERAAARGDASAAEYLVGLALKSAELSEAGRARQAYGLMVKYSGMDLSAALWREVFLLKAGGVKSEPELETLNGLIQRHRDANTEEFQRRLYQKNANASVYMAQRYLRRVGIYTGPFDGIAGPATLEAVVTACTTRESELHCGGDYGSSRNIAKMASLQFIVHD